MAITITAYDANKDGKGIDFAAYLKAYDKTYVPSSRGSFSSAPVGSTFDAAQYASYNGSKYGVVLSAVKGKNFKYSWKTRSTSSTAPSLTSSSATRSRPISRPTASR